MYRSPTTPSLLHGLPGGPFTGGPFHVSREVLSVRGRAQLDAALGGQVALAPLVSGPAGLHLFPLDLVRVEGSRLVVRPLGSVHDARFEGEDLVLAFTGGEVVRLPVPSEDRDRVRRSLAQTDRLLHELTANPDLSRQLALDPFFELRESGFRATARERRPWSRPSRGALLAALGVLGAFAFAFAASAVERTTEAAAHAKTPRAAPSATESSPLVLPAPTPEADARCLAALRARQAKAHPRAVEILADVVTHTDTSDTRVVPIRFRRAGQAAAAPLAWKPREERLARAFERTFSETCPAHVIRFACDAATDGARAVLQVDYAVRAGAPIPIEGTDAPLVSVETTFDVTLRGPPGEERFTLTMPPPERGLRTVRERSIFSAPTGTPYEQADAALTARAFDRLYDEVHGLFFEGPIVVPVEEPPAFPAPPL